MNTTKGTAYRVTAIPAVTKVAEVAGLKIAADSGDAVRIDWEPGGDAATFAIDRAIGDTPTYSRIATGLSTARYVDAGAPVATERHIRYRVVAIAASGRESAGAPIFRLLPRHDDVRALRIDDDVFGYDATAGALPSTRTTDGKYAVAMNWNGGNFTEVRLGAKATGSVSLRSRTLEQPIRVEANGRPVSATVDMGTLTLPVEAGATYRIVSQAAVSAAVPHGAVLTGGTIPAVVRIKADKTRLGSAIVTSRLPEGWRAEPASIRLAGVAPGRTATARFVISAPPTVADDTYALDATVKSADWAGVVPFDVTVKIPNLALGKPAAQSSLSVSGVPISTAGGVAARAVDDNADGQAEAATVAGTLTENEPWRQVDLGSMQAIGTILIWNRTDSCCRAALSHYHVLVSAKPIVAKTLAEALAQPGIWSSHLTTVPAPNARLTVNYEGRYVSI